MENVRLPPDNDPATEIEVAGQAVRTFVQATAMGIVPAGAMPECLDAGAVSDLVRYAQQAGIGRGLVREPAVAYGTNALAALLEELQAALEASPVPGTEWPSMERLFGVDRLAVLLGISPSSLRRYLSGDRATPDEVAARLHFLALVVGDLAGSYNDIGVRRWFERKRSQLDGGSPAELLQGSWDPDEEGPRRVRALATALLGSPST